MLQPPPKPSLVGANFWWQNSFCNIITGLAHWAHLKLATILVIQVILVILVNLVILVKLDKLEVSVDKQATQVSILCPASH